MKVIIYCAVTLDGKIARSAIDPIDWTTKEDKKIFAAETKKAGVVIMGHTTFKSIGRPLKDRLNIVYSSAPEKEKNRRGVLEFVNGDPRSLLRRLSRRGFKKVFVIGGSKINGLFLKENLVEEIWLTIAPRIFGSGIGLIEGGKLERQLSLISLKRLSRGFVQCKYRVLDSATDFPER